MSFTIVPIRRLQWRQRHTHPGTRPRPRRRIPSILIGLRRRPRSRYPWSVALNCMRRRDPHRRMQIFILRIGDGFECVGGWCGGVAHGRSGGVELPERGRGRVMSDSGGAGAATVVVVAMHGETPVGSPNVGALMIEYMVAGSKRLVPQDCNSK